MNNAFELISSLQIFLSADALEPLQLAVQDLMQDIQKATGGAVKPLIVHTMPSHDGIVVRILPEVFPNEAVENYNLHSEANNLLFIDGSDMRGAIYGIYAFSADFLHIDPCYLWTQIPIRRLKSFRWENIERQAGNPAIRYRGVFINDEDLLTEWEIGGPRHTEYKYYHTVISRNTARRVAETLIRMGYNLAIPASFVDIRNPEEEMLLEEFSRRGFILTMHHVEPLGVSAFGFDNYWRAKGLQKEFSYFSDPDALREVWSDSIRRWSKYPEIIWQLGLRGRGDRPFWEAGKAPESDEERAAVIANAIHEQKELVLRLTNNQNAVFSTTLWGEGSIFNRRGLLKISPDIITVFSDNCAGWRLQDDFFEAPVDPSANYGVYCHHAIICGTHLAQAIGVRDFQNVLCNAMEKRKLCYAIFNSSNVREFIYGMNGTAKITVNLANFSPEDYLRKWVDKHFSANQDEICQCYRDYLGAFEKNSRGVAICNDGLMIHRCNKALKKIFDGDRNGAEKDKKANTFMEALSDMFPDTHDTADLIRRLAQQGGKMMEIHRRAKELQSSLPQEEANFLYAQIIYPSGLHRYFCRCEYECQLALQAFQTNDDEAMQNHLRDARHALNEYKELIPDYLTGQYVHWYDGCQKVDYRTVLEKLDKLLV
jgi:hypothetical protein